MQLTPAADGDLRAVVALVNSAYRGDSARQGWTHEADYLDGQRTDEPSLRAELAARPAARMLMLRDDPESAPVGCVWLEPDEGEAWYLGMLTVRPDAQNGRIGRALLQAAEMFAQENGARRMRMTVINIRDSLIAWYGRRGYRTTGETRPFPYGDPNVGQPRREDLSFVVLEKVL